MATLTITITGDSVTDLEYALEEITRLVTDDYTSGFDRNETGGYSFEIDGELQS